MIQLRVDGIFLDLYETEPIKLNFSVEDIITTEATSTYSKTFRVPSTSKNNEFFKNVFMVSGYDFDITQVRTATILYNGNEFRTGQLRLRKIYINKELSKIDYEVVFFGETRSLASSIGEGTLSELNLTGITHDYTLENIVASWQAFPEGSITDGLVGGDVIYPLVNFGYNYDPDGSYDPTDFGTISFDATNHFTQQSHPLTVDRFRPMIRTKRILDQIFEDAGFTYESEFLNSNKFKQIYTSAWGNQKKVFLDDNALNIAKMRNTAPVFNTVFTAFPSFFTDALPFIYVDYDYGDNLDGPFNSNILNKYVVPITGQYTFQVRLNLRQIFNTFGQPNSSYSGQINLWAGGNIVDLSSFNELIPGGFTSYVLNDTVILGATVNLTVGDEVYVECNGLYDGGDFNFITKEGSFFECTEAPGNVQPTFYLDDKYKKIDYLKDVLKAFRLVLIPDKIVNNHFKIEPWNEYIGTGNLYDWSNKIDIKKDIILEPLFLEQPARMIFTFNEDGDYLNTINQDELKEVYGTLIVDQQNELLKGDREIKLGFGATPSTQIEGANENNNGMANTIIPQPHIHEGGQHLPMKPKTRLLFYNGLQSTGLDASNEDTWYAEFTTGGTTGFTDFPMVSIYEDWPLQNNSTLLTWQHEVGYIKFDLDDILKGRTLYEEYWSDYVNLLYDPFSRRLTGYFILEAADLTDFNFNDVIFFQGEYYYVEKIENAVIGQKTPVKVSLIKLINYSVNTDGFVPPVEFNIWNTTTSNWEVGGISWND